MCFRSWFSSPTRLSRCSGAEGGAEGGDDDEMAMLDAAMAEIAAVLKGRAPPKREPPTQATIEAMLQFAQSLTTLLDEHPIVVGDWSHSRMNEVLAPLLWLVDHAPSGSDLKPVFSLLSKYQAQGFDWASWILSPGSPPAAATGLDEGGQGRGEGEEGRGRKQKEGRR